MRVLVKEKTEPIRVADKLDCPKAIWSTGKRYAPCMYQATISVISKEHEGKLTCVESTSNPKSSPNASIGQKLIKSEQ